MAEGLAIGSGFAQGLTKVLLGKRQKDNDEAFQRENRNVNIKLSLLPEIIKRAESYADVQPFIDELLGEQKGKGGKKPKAGEPDVHGLLSQVLGPALGGGDPTAAQEVAGVDATVKTPPRQTMFGVPVLSDTELSERDLARTTATTKATETAKLDAQTDAKMSMAERLRSIDPSMSVEDSLIAVGLKVPQDEYGTVPQGGGIYKKRGAGAGEITEPASAKTEKLTGALGERTREIMAVNPQMDESSARSQAATELSTERKANTESVQANRESIQANRAIQKTLLQMQEAQGGVTPNNAAAMTTQLRRDWTKAVKPFQERQTYVGKLNEMITPDKDGKTGIQRDRNVATQTIINSFNRLLEEQNTVREGEYQRSEELTPLSTWVEAQLLALQSGGGKLTDAQLSSIAKEGIRIAQVTSGVYEDGLKDQRLAMDRQLQKYKIPSEDVFGNSTVGSPFSVTLNGETFKFPSQAKLDTFKRQFPAAQ